MSEAGPAAPGGPTGMPELHLEGFDGPMDLLLDLAERQRVDLGRMSIQALAEQFVAALVSLGDRVPLERRADWVVLATRLILLRSRLRFAADAAAAEREAAAELDRIAAFARMRDAGNWLGARPQLGRETFARPPAPLSREGGYVALMEACLAVLNGGDAVAVASGPGYVPPDAAFWLVADALTRIRALLAGTAAAELGCFLPDVAPDLPQRPLRARAALATTLLAGLELAREGVLTLAQDAPFGPVMVMAAPAPRNDPSHHA